MDRMDTYRILETDLTKWEKIEAMAAPCEGSCGVVYRISNDIHNNVNFEKINNLEQNAINTLKSSYSNVVMPLQYNTNEYQISNSRCPEVANFGSNFHEVNLCVPASADTSLWNSNDLKANSSSQQNLLYKNGICSGNAYFSMLGCAKCNRVEVQRMEKAILRSLTQVASMSTVDAGGNVHSGAPPPWLEAADQTFLNDHVKPALSSFLSSNKSHKSRKLNPKGWGLLGLKSKRWSWRRRRRREERLSRVILMLIGFLILVEFGSHVAERNLEKNLRLRNKSSSRLKVILRCQSRYSLTSVNKCEKIMVNDE